MREYIIGGNEAGQSLVKYLSKLLPKAPSSFFYKMMRKKNIVLGGAKCTGSEKLAVGDNVKLFLSEETIEKFGGILDGNSDKKGSVRENSADDSIVRRYPYRPLDIIYEDEDMIFVNKPQGMLTQKARPEDISLNEYIIGYLLHTGALKKAELHTFKPSVCNRLDRNTSGLVLAGKSLRGLQDLSGMIKDKTLQKYYITVVKGRVKQDGGADGYLVKDGTKNKVSVRKEGEDAKGRAADKERYIRTDYHVLYTAKDYTVLEVHLLTGRSHQIRAHLAALGHPVLGDCKYGDRALNEKYRLKEQLLHAYRVVLPDGREYTAPLPKEFKPYADLEFTGASRLHT